MGFLVYIVGDDLNLFVQFFEMISSDSNVIVEPGFLSWMTEQQLMLPLDSGWKLYQAKAHLINQKYETYETKEAHLEGWHIQLYRYEAELVGINMDISSWIISVFYSDVCYTKQGYYKGLYSWRGSLCDIGIRISGRTEKSGRKLVLVSIRKVSNVVIISMI